MSVPKSTKIWVGIWVALAGFNLLIAITDATLGDWYGAWDSFAAACIYAFIASLIYERDKAREFRRHFLRSFGGTR